MVAPFVKVISDGRSGRSPWPSIVRSILTGRPGGERVGTASMGIGPAWQRAEGRSDATAHHARDVGARRACRCGGACGRRSRGQREHPVQRLRGLHPLRKRRRGGHGDAERPAAHPDHVHHQQQSLLRDRPLPAAEPARNRHRGTRLPRRRHHKGQLRRQPGEWAVHDNVRKQLLHRRDRGRALVSSARDVPPDVQRQGKRDRLPGPPADHMQMRGPLAVLAAAAVAAAASGTASAKGVEHYGHHPYRVHGNATTSPTGLSPATIKSVYSFPTGSTAGAGKTIAIVDAYDDPSAESDLGVFSSQFGLPQCTTANGCFKRVDQRGGATYPRKDSGWALEISLDIEWAHAIAPGAKILLVEADSNSFTNLLAAEDYARAHAQYVSNSWGAGEFSSEASFDSHFVQPGVSFFVSSGDAGLPAEYPSASPKVISVGGTTLNFDAFGAFVSETGWSSGGGGCAAYERANAVQSVFAGYAQ